MQPYRQGTGIEPSLKGDIPLQIIYREGIPVIKTKRLPFGETSIALHIYTLEGVIIQEYNVSENSETPLVHIEKRDIYTGSPLSIKLLDSKNTTVMTSGRKEFSLLELNACVRNTLQESLPERYWVRAEISEARIHPSGSLLFWN